MYASYTIRIRFKKIKIKNKYSSVISKTSDANKKYFVMQREYLTSVVHMTRENKIGTARLSHRPAFKVLLNW